MRTILLNGKQMNSKKNAHLYLKKRINFPAYYGKNLDALWDVLSTISSPIDLVLFNLEYLEESLGSYSEAILDVFKEAAASNKCISFRIMNIKIK